MGKIRLIVLDILKPHEPSILKLSSDLSDLDGVDGVDVSVFEIDSKVETVKATIVGKDINFEQVNTVVEDMGASIHSIDKVSAGKNLIKEVFTHQDMNSNKNGY